ncbi:MAG: U32 family peptidase [Spirochaetota bacterium]
MAVSCLCGIVVLLLSMNMKEIELLAPGGDADSVKAALVAGADVVYMGLSRFNARKRAVNISENDLGDLILIAHNRGARIYITVNVIITEDELTDCVNLIKLCLAKGADAFIVQDYGLLYLLKNLFPNAEVHASTQLTTHNTGQISFLKKFGVKQCNLSRELSQDEIKQLVPHAHDCGIKAEMFIHGAYCISFSGQCFMSSFMAGLSGNRGACVQPCRRRYRLSPAGEKSCLLNLKDNCAFKDAATLAALDVDAVKIEGRIKNFFYVYSVVRAWEKQLKRIKEGRIPATEDRRLEKVFNREFSAGYLNGKISGGMFQDSPLDKSLTVLGEVFNYSADRRRLTVRFTAEHSAVLPAGTRLNIYTRDNVFICTAFIEDQSARDSFVIRIEHELKGKILPGQFVCGFPEAHETEKVKREIENLRPSKIPLHVRLEGKIGSSLTAVFTAESRINIPAGEEKPTVQVESAILLQYAKDNPLSEETITGRLAKLGDTPYILKNVDISQLEKQLFIPVSEINRMRREAISLLNPLNIEKNDLSLPVRSKKDRTIKSELVLFVSETEEADYFSQQFPIVLFEVTDPGTLPKAGNIIPYFPSIALENALGDYSKLVESGKFSKIVSDNSGLGITASKKGVTWIAGPAFHCSNSYAFFALKELGKAEGAFFSRELSVQQIKNIKPLEAVSSWLFVFGPLLLMTTRQCLYQRALGCPKEYIDEDCFLRCGRRATIYDEKNNPFHIVKRPWRHNELYNDSLLFYPKGIGALNGIINYFVLDFRNLGFHDLSLEIKIKIADFFTKCISDWNSTLIPEKEIRGLLPPITKGHFNRGLV